MREARGRGGGGEARWLDLADSMLRDCLRGTLFVTPTACLLLQGSVLKLDLATNTLSEVNEATDAVLTNMKYWGNCQLAPGEPLGRFTLTCYLLNKVRTPKASLVGEQRRSPMN